MTQCATCGGQQGLHASVLPGCTCTSRYLIDSTKTAAVDREYYWRPMTSCPVGSKVQLLGASGVAAYGKWSGKDNFWRGWAPLPKVPDWMRDA